MLSDVEIARRMGQRDARRYRKEHGSVPPCVVIRYASRDELAQRLRWERDLDAHPRYSDILMGYMAGWDGVGRGPGRPRLDRTRRIYISMTEAEREMLEDVARGDEKSAGEWARDALLDAVSVAFKRVDLEDDSDRGML